MNRLRSLTAELTVWLLMCVGFCLLHTFAIAEGPWKLELPERGVVLVSIAEPEYRGTWLVELNSEKSRLNSASKVNWSTCILDERFRIRTKTGATTDEPILKNLKDHGVDLNYNLDLQFVDDSIIPVRGILGRNAFHNLCIQFGIEHNEAVVTIAPIESLESCCVDESHYSIPVDFNENHGLQAVLNISSHPLSCAIQTSGKNDIALPAEISAKLQGARRSMRPVGVSRRFSTMDASVSDPELIYDWYCAKLFFEGIDMDNVYLLEDQPPSILLHMLLRRNACLVLNNAPKLYLSKLDNPLQDRLRFTDITIIKVDGEYVVDYVHPDGRFAQDFAKGDVIIYLDAISTKMLTPSQFWKLAADCFQRGAPTEIRRNGSLIKISVRTQELSASQLIDFAYLRN